MATRTVMIVDDILFVRKTLAEILSEAHYQVIGEATNGKEAVTLYTKLRPDLVTMDIVMPEESGIMAARKILKMDQGARIIMISAMGQESLVMEAINVGVRDFVMKPFTTATVLQALERVFIDDTHPGSHSTSQARKTGLG